MNDRELLERAAKAAGFYSYNYENSLAENKWGSGKRWNPLTDDGDALRLAVKLGLYDLDDLLFQFGTDPLIDTGIDPYAATRRAIVRAAAALAEPPKC